MFRCNQCSKSFDDRLDLKRHLSIKHFNYIPYLCKICKKAGQFHQTAIDEDMDRHFETVHPGVIQSIILSRDKEIEAKIKSALEKCQLPTTQNISLEFKNDSAYSAMCDLSPFGVNAAESGSISSHVRQEQNNGEMTQNEAIDDIEIVFESLPHKVKDEFESPKGISLGFKNALRQVYDVFCDERTIETSAMESESSRTNQDIDYNEEGERSSSEMKQELSNNEATENITADKNDVHQRKMIVQRESNVNLLETASESHTGNEERDCPTTLATESNSCANDAPIFAFPETKSFHGSPTMSSATQSHSRLKSVVVLDERDAIEPAIQTPMQSSSNNPVAKLPRKRTFTKNDRHCRTKASAKRSNPKKTNGTEKVHKCNQCTYTCVRKSDVLRHMRTHTGAKPYKCDKCSYVCARRDLTVHMRIHTGEKPFKCNLCSYAGARSDNLNLHIRTHTGVKPYKCIKCNFASARNKDLKEHMRTHTGEKPFKCSFCAFASARISALKCHVRTHTGHKPYKCSECSYAGISSSQLQSHVRSNHSEEKK